ncbi:MAG TPA: AI-2E family transporter [Burkholderiaceae bacterium]|nr:AI-2E family transporter [Burkholderiaceae bacterium]
MPSRFQAFVSGAVLALIVGWVLHIGKDVLVPAVFGAVVVYIIVGLTRALERLPLVGQRLPLQLRYLLSIAVIGFLVVATGYLLIANRDHVIALAPQYQATLLAAAQKVAQLFGIETEPTWATLRKDMLARVNVQVLLGSMLSSVSSIAVTVVVVLLYAVFLLVEQHVFDAKLARLSSDPQQRARLRKLIGDINGRVGAYLALKTLLSLLLGAVSWVVMRYFDLQFAPFWAVLIAVLNFVPYLGSVLGVMFPAIMAIVQFVDPGLVFSLVLALTVVQFLIGNFLDPYVMGSSLNLSPFAILISLAVWSQLWGIPGAFLAVPITAILAIVLSEFAGTRPIAVLLSRDGRL